MSPFVHHTSATRSSAMSSHRSCPSMSSAVGDEELPIYRRRLSSCEIHSSSFSHAYEQAVLSQTVFHPSTSRHREPFMTIQLPPSYEDATIIEVDDESKQDLLDDENVGWGRSPSPTSSTTTLTTTTTALKKCRKLLWWQSSNGRQCTSPTTSDSSEEEEQ